MNSARFRTEREQDVAREKSNANTAIRSECRTADATLDVLLLRAGGYAGSELARLLPVEVQRLDAGQQGGQRLGGRVSVTGAHPITAGIPASQLAWVTYANQVELRCVHYSEFSVLLD